MIDWAAPSSPLLESFVQAQLANYIQYRALIEGWNTWMWTRYTGVLIWKTQNPWPGLRGQMYDHLLDQTGAFFGLKHAAEPVHVQLNLSTYTVQVCLPAFLSSWLCFVFCVYCCCFGFVFPSLWARQHEKSPQGMVTLKVGRWRERERGTSVAYI